MKISWGSGFRALNPERRSETTNFKFYARTYVQVERTARQAQHPYLLLRSISRVESGKWIY